GGIGIWRVVVCAIRGREASAKKKEARTDKRILVEVSQGPFIRMHGAISVEAGFGKPTLRKANQRRPSDRFRLHHRPKDLPPKRFRGLAQDLLHPEILWSAMSIANPQGVAQSCLRPRRGERRTRA